MSDTGERGHIDENEESYRETAEAGDTEAMRRLGNLLLNRGDMDEAETWYRRAIDAGDAMAINNLGVVFERRGDLVEAETLFHKAAESDVALAMYNLGRLMEERGDLAGAETCFRKSADVGSVEATHRVRLLQDAVIRTACEAVTHAVERLSNDASSLDQASSRMEPARRIEIGRAALEGMINDLNATVEPVLATWAELASRGVNNAFHLRVALGAFLELSEVAASPFDLAIDSFNELIAWKVQESASVFQKYLTVQRTAQNVLNPLETSDQKVMYFERTYQELLELVQLVEEVLDLKRTAHLFLDLESIYGQYLEALRLLKEVLDLKRTDWKALEPPVRKVLALRRADQMLVYLEPAHRELTKSERTDRKVLELLLLVEDHLNTFLNWDEPSEGLIGSRPPGPAGFDAMQRENELRQAREQALHERALAFVESVVPDEPGSESSPASRSASGDSDADVPGPYDDLQEPWIRRLMRFARRTGDQ